LLIAGNFHIPATTTETCNNKNSHGGICSIVVEKQIGQQHKERHRIDGVGANRLGQSHQNRRQTKAK